MAKPIAGDWGVLIMNSSYDHALVLRIATANKLVIAKISLLSKADHD